MRLYIDASNIRAGGGVTHLVELLKAADPSLFGFSKVVLFAPLGTLTKVQDRPWLDKRHLPVMECSFLARALWQAFAFSRLVDREGADVVFVPGGSFVTGFRPLITMSQNLLPFQWEEMFRYKGSLFFLKLLLLRRTQSSSFRRASGVIFLTEYALGVVRGVTRLPEAVAVISHGVDQRFRAPPKQQHSIESYSMENPFKLLYVSTIDAYKHQAFVVRAVKILRKRGVPVSIDFIGGGDGPCLENLLREIEGCGIGCARYLGLVPYDELHSQYRRADAFVFASSCETIGNILIEAMSSGLPIVCSDRGAMPEVLGEAGLYFDPESAESIADAIDKLVRSPSLRGRLSAASFERSSIYSWEKCAKSTFEFISAVAMRKSIH